MYADDLESDFKRALLASLKASLPAVLPMLTSALEQHFGQALAAAQGGAKDAATAHAAVVTAALGESGWRTLVPSKAIVAVGTGVRTWMLLHIHAAANASSECSCNLLSRCTGDFRALGAAPAPSRRWRDHGVRVSAEHERVPAHSMRHPQGHNKQETTAGELPTTRKFAWLNNHRIACRTIRCVTAPIQLLPSQEPAAVYGSTMAAAGTGFMQTAASLLQAPAELDFEGANDEFGRRLCDTMSLFGQQHISTFEHRAAFMQQVRTLLSEVHRTACFSTSTAEALVKQ